MVNKEEGEDTTLHRNDLNALNTVDNEESDEIIPRGNEWEVVSLTASAYAASPGPRGDESIHEENSGTADETDEAETSRALFMSRHFVFPPSQHENLPIEPDNSEIPKGDEGSEDVHQTNAQIEGKSEKEDEHWNLGNLNVPEELTSCIDVKGNVGLSIHGTEFDDTTDVHGLNVDDKEPDIFGTNKFSYFHTGNVIDGLAVYDENAVLSDLIDASSIGSQSPKSGKKEFDDSELPCGAWWRRGVASICAHAKETSTYWSIFVAAAVIGLVLLGQRWQQERWQVLQQRWQLSISDEKSRRILARLKEAIVGGSCRGTYITASLGEH